MTGYPYDPDRLARTAALLYAHLPAHLKTADERAAGKTPPGEEELRTFVDILAAPLAALRQSIEELQADFFVETAGDEMLPLLAESIGLELLFREAEANRRDLTGAVARRRRKGTPAMLEEMARALSDRLVATNEGWKLVQITQDLNIRRLTRTTPDLHAPSVAERIAGPLESIARSVDPRPIGARSGRVHPRHMAHWAHLSQMFPLVGASPHRLPDGAADLRFAFDAQNAWRALRVRATGVDDSLRTDRVPEQIFAEAPGEWFAQDGRFSVRIANLPAAAAAVPALRTARTVAANESLYATPPGIELIDYDGARTSGPLEVAVMAVPLTGTLPDDGAAVLRARIELDLSGQVGGGGPAGAAPAGAIPMLRLAPSGGAASRFFGGAVLRVTGGQVRSRRASATPELAQEGYRDGALYIRVPPLRVTGTRWFYIGADGGLHHAASSGASGIDRPLNTDGRLPPRAVSTPPIGPVWPEAPASAERQPFAPPLAAPHAAPLVLHGGQVLRPTGLSLLPPGETCALVFALTFAALGRQFRPMLRLVWQGSEPSGAIWEPVAQSGAPAADLTARFAALAAVVEAGGTDMALALRFESSRAGAIMSPAEIGFTAHDGRSVMIHAPELAASDTDLAWPRGPAPIAAHSVAVQVGRDGSTWTAGTNLLRRRALGSGVPLRGPIAIQRRVLKWRRLCPWENETLTELLDPVAPGRLDIDPRFGLFAMAASEPPQEHPTGPAPQPGAVSVEMQAGATMAIGALPLDHDRALARAPEMPTRLVSASGHLGPGADPARAGHTLHPTLGDALLAVAADPQPREVIEVADSRFYAGEALTWPVGPQSLAIRAAAGTQPVIEVASSITGAAQYDALELTGLALSAAGALTLSLPQAQQVTLHYVTVRGAELTLQPSLFEDTGVEQLTITRSILGPLALADAGHIVVDDCILDAGSDGLADAVVAERAALTMDRTTVLGSLRVERVDISDSILRHPVFAGERFSGCIRYSMLAPGGQTPRKHRVVSDVFPRFVTFDRRDAAYLRLVAATDSRILTGASDGGEMGAFNRARVAEIERAVARRLAEHTPAGLRTGLIRQN